MGDGYEPRKQTPAVASAPYLHDASHLEMHVLWLVRWPEQQGEYEGGRAYLRVEHESLVVNDESARRDEPCWVDIGSGSLKNEPDGREHQAPRVDHAGTVVAMVDSPETSRTGSLGAVLLEQVGQRQRHLAGTCSVASQ